jgi:hypothetical protein
MSRRNTASNGLISSRTRSHDRHEAAPAPRKPHRAPVAEALEELGPQERRLHTRHRMQRRSLCRDDECHSPGSPAFATPSRSPARQQPPAPAQHQHRADDADAEGLRVSGFRWGSPERARPPAELSSALRSWRHALEDADAHVRQGRRALDAWGAAPPSPASRSATPRAGRARVPA